MTKTEQGAMRFNTGKSPLSMVLEARHALNGCASVLQFGAKKYARGNWHRGLNHTEICDSLARHMSAYLAGEDTDPESGLLHVDHIMCNAVFLAEGVRTHPELDDRSEELKEPDGEYDKVYRKGKPTGLRFSEDIKVNVVSGGYDGIAVCSLFMEGNKWCVMFKGESFPTTNLIGFGGTQVEAIADFRNSWNKSLQDNYDKR